MARKGFLDGVITGGILGAVVGVLLVPQFKPSPANVVKRQVRRAGNRAKKVTADMARDKFSDLSDMMD